MLAHSELATSYPLLSAPRLTHLLARYTCSLTLSSLPLTLYFLNLFSPICSQLTTTSLNVYHLTSLISARQLGLGPACTTHGVWQIGLQPSVAGAGVSQCVEFDFVRYGRTHGRFPMIQVRSR